MTITVSPLRTEVSASPAEIQRARAEFDRNHCLLLPGFFGPALLQRIRRGLKEGNFSERTHEGIGVELCLQPDTTTAMLEFVSNDPVLFGVIRQLTGCGPIGCFGGRVYRMLPGGAHYDSWHTDVDGKRLIAMSVNLSEERYAGGLLQIRNGFSGRIVSQVANVGLGDAILLRVDPRLSHQVTPVKGSSAKTAYAGWFRSEPDYQLLMTERMAQLAGSPALLEGQSA